MADNYCRKVTQPGEPLGARGGRSRFEHLGAGVSPGLSRRAIVGAGLTSGLFTWAVSSGLVAQPKAISLAQILDSFRRSPGVSATFVEEKRIKLLKAPLLSRGSIHFEADGKLARRVASPAPSVMLLVGSTLSLWEGGSVRRIDLVRQPAVGVLVFGFSHLLRGDRAELEKLFAVSFSAKGHAWQLVLEPKNAALGRVIRKITVEGSELTLKRLVVAERNGDVSVSSFSDVNTRRKFTAGERRVLFALPTKK